jgi:hypothetical protein
MVRDAEANDWNPDVPLRDDTFHIPQTQCVAKIGPHEQNDDLDFGISPF